VIVLLVANITMYILRNRSIMLDIKNTLRVSATNIAALVPIEAHERLYNLDQQNSADYKQIESLFKLAIAGNPNISDIYTLRPTSDPHKMIFVVSAQTTRDVNGDNNISEDEIKPAIGEVFDTTGFPRLEESISHPTVDDRINYDKWGAWLSGYAPIKTDGGKTAAVLGIDYSADYIAGLRKGLWKTILYVDLILLPLLFLLAWYLSYRLSRPFSSLAYGLERLAHGDLDYHPTTTHHRDEKVFDDMFNRIVTLFAAIKNRKPPED